MYSLCIPYTLFLLCCDKTVGRLHLSYIRSVRDEHTPTAHPLNPHLVEDLILYSVGQVVWGKLVLNVYTSTLFLYEIGVCLPFVAYQFPTGETAYGKHSVCTFSSWPSLYLTLPSRVKWYLHRHHRRRLPSPPSPSNGGETLSPSSHVKVVTANKFVQSRTRQYDVMHVGVVATQLRLWYGLWSRIEI